MPAERDSFYKVLRVFDARAAASTDAELAIGADADGSAEAARASSHPRRRVTCCASAAFPYINCYPVYGAIDRGLVPIAAQLVDGVPTRAQRAYGATVTLDVSVVSAVEYARDAERYLLLPELAISCDGPVQSVMLFSHASG